MPGSEKAPSSHGVQLAAPRAAAKVDGGHMAQKAAPAAAAARPGGHCRQGLAAGGGAATPGAARYEPAAHAAHVDALALRASVPCVPAKQRVATPPAHHTPTGHAACAPKTSAPEGVAAGTAAKPGETGCGAREPTGQKEVGLAHGAGRRPHVHTYPAGQLGVAPKEISRTVLEPDAVKKMFPAGSTAMKRGVKMDALRGAPPSPVSAESRCPR
jgi:hypothetical protein